METVIVTVLLVLVGLAVVAIRFFGSADLLLKRGGVHILPKKWEDRFLDNGPHKRHAKP